MAHVELSDHSFKEISSSGQLEASTDSKNIEKQKIASKMEFHMIIGNHMKLEKNISFYTPSKSIDHAEFKHKHSKLIAAIMFPLGALWFVG